MAGAPASSITFCPSTATILVDPLPPPPPHPEATGPWWGEQKGSKAFDARRIEAASPSPTARARAGGIRADPRPGRDPAHRHPDGTRATGGQSLQHDHQQPANTRPNRGSGSWTPLSHRSPARMGRGWRHALPRPAAWERRRPPPTSPAEPCGSRAKPSAEHQAGRPATRSGTKGRWWPIAPLSPRSSAGPGVLGTAGRTPDRLATRSTHDRSLAVAHLRETRVQHLRDGARPRPLLVRVRA